MGAGDQTGRYDLEGRTKRFALDVRSFVRRIPRTIANTNDVRQLVRASGSVGANYIEANESLSRKDFRMRIKICRKEAKECTYWLDLLGLSDGEMLEGERDILKDEATQLMKIFGAILRNSSD